MKHKLERLKKKIASCRQKDQPQKQDRQKIKGGSIGLSLEIVAATAVGFLMGFYLDKWLDFRFLFKISCSLLAFISSFVNIYRTLIKGSNKK